MTSDSVLAQAIENLAAILRAPQETGERINKAAERLIAAAQKATPEDRAEALRRLSGLIRLDDWKRAGVAALICGAFVEKGADPAPMADAVLAWIVPALRKSATDPMPVPIEAREAPREPQRQPGFFGTMWRFWKAMRRAKQQRAAAGTPRTEHGAIIEAFTAPTIAMFASSPALRAAHPEVRALAESLSDRVACCGWLQTIFDVLENEPLLVIEPSTRTGILARLSGTDVNFTLTTLLMDRFPGMDGQPLSRLTQRAAAVLSGVPNQVTEDVTGVWNLYTWQAVRPDLTLPSGQTATEHWIWNEGKPADIPLFEARRVILLGPAAYIRTWPAQRTFAAMQPELRIEAILTRDEIQGWLERMAGANAMSKLC